MSLEANFDAAADLWLQITGEPGTYYPASGGSVELIVTIERAVQTLDDQGLVTRRTIACIAKADIEKPVEGDTFHSEGHVWILTGFVGSGDHTHELFVKDGGPIP